MSVYRLIPLLLLLIFEGCLTASAPPVIYPELPLMPYCDLVAKPVQFNGQLVRVRATYLSGFEQSAFTADGCDHWAWVDFAKDYERNTSKRVRRVFEFVDGPVEIVAVGVFTGVRTTRVVFGHMIHEGFGHMGGSEFRFEVQAVESVRATHQPRRDAETGSEPFSLLRRSESHIESWLLEEAPLGSSVADVKSLVERHGWQLNYEWQGTESHASPRDYPYVNGGHIVGAYFGHYQGIPWRVDVDAFWGFDKQGTLIDLHVRKSYDSI